MQIRLDQVVLSSFHEAYQNYDNPLPQNIVIASTPLANGGVRTFSVTIPYSRANTRADVYATSSSYKTLLSGSGRAAASVIYTYASSEIAWFNVIYSSGEITVTLTISNNTGGSITPVAQTISISVVQYQAPITAV